MTNFPEFIDNREGNTLARALRTFLGSHEGKGRIGFDAIPDSVCIATAYFSPTGFSQIADSLKSIPTVRILLGADQTAELSLENKRLDERWPAFERRRILFGLDQMQAALFKERDSLPFSRASREALRKLIEAFRSDNVEVRRYEKTFLHAKAYIVSSTKENTKKPEGIIVGSSNLTGAGLNSNLELNLGRYEQPIVKLGQQWFDDLWDEAEPYDLAVIFEEVFQPRTPWEVFIRVLWHLYGDEVEEDTRKDQELPLTSFQKHGVARALRLIQKIGGVIVADEVGLGKTFIAGEILQIYHGRRQRALLICPASLRDSTWRKFLTRFQLFVECLSFEELANDGRLRADPGAYAGQKKLQRSLDEYQLVIIDEAHNYRNPDTPTRAGVLRELLFGQRRDLLLLTATPVNNSLWDLYHLIRFFIRQDAHFSEQGILSIRRQFELAMREDPSNLSPDLLYPIIDATTVKRTRQFVKKHYSNDQILDTSGKRVPIVFPQPNAISVRYNIDDILPGFFDRLEAALDPDSTDSISFSRYSPNAYLLAEINKEESGRMQAMIGLLRSGLLKRFESSVFAFQQTVKKMIHEHEQFLKALESGYIVTTAFMKELSADDDAIFDDVLAGTEHRRDASDYNVDLLRANVERDLELLQYLVIEVEEITPDRDPKLQVLADELVKIVKQAQHEAISTDDEAQKRKIIVFSFFEDTVKWIRNFLHVEFKRRSELACYLGRMVAVSGSGSLTEVSRQEAVQGFAPISMEASNGQDDDRYDLLISTDMLAEGVNLQQCRHIVNFDMPWNPMRLVQRHGRIDRIGSPHNRVFIRTIFPADRIDRLLNLEQRILDKLALAAASVGVAAPIEGSSHGPQVFTETRDEIEKLLEGDASLYERGGTVGAAQTGEEYRQTLRKALTQGRERIVGLPWKIGSGMIKGTRRGIFFCAVVGKHTYLRFVPADEAWVAVEENAILREVGTCLRLIECESHTSMWCPHDLQDRVYDFWEIARDDILSEWMRETDPANLQPRVRPLNLRVAEFIRANPPVGMPEDQMIKALDILESPWPRREEIMLRGWFEAEGHEGVALSQFLVRQVLDIGLEPVEPPPLLPPIEPEDIELLCWMGIDCDSANGA